MSRLQIAAFTNIGYHLHARQFKPLRTDLTGKTVVVTGATGGLGLATSRRLGSMGARVIMVGRSEDKLNAAKASVDGTPSMEVADLSLMTEVRALGKRILESEPRIDVLVNNVGVLLPQREATGEGLEKTLATNLAGHFLLTNLLIPRLLESAPARVISVSSGGMYSEKIRPDDLQFANREYSGTATYAHSKRGQVIVTEMWAERFPDRQIVFHSMHPGWAATAGVARSLPTFNTLMKPFLRTPEQGADTIVWLAAATEPAATTGQFWFDRAIAPTHLVDSTREAAADRARLWDELVALTGSDVLVG
jgi:NAD(P)-dependent dehydrogenase (short-subunit alcohol dehydrogenase family)